MGKTNIGWTATQGPDGTWASGYSFNPWIGCTKTASGCKNCYAEALARTRMGLDVWGTDRPRRIHTVNADYWQQLGRWDAKAERDGVSGKVFVGSMMDFFEVHPNEEINKQLDDARWKMYWMFYECQNLTFLVLTKRPENIFRLAPTWWLDDPGFPKNVWLGVSASTQAELERNWFSLQCETSYFSPTVRFVSLEPLLEPVSVEFICEEVDLGDGEEPDWNRAPDWVIVGAESGPRSRPFNVAWAESVYEKCRKYGIPFFGKQDSGLRPGKPLLIHGREIKEFPDE